MDINLTADTTTLKTELPIPYVMAAYGHEPQMTTEGRLHYINPFRPDANPSFDVFERGGTQRWGDFAEGKGGDVFDLVGRFEKTDRWAAKEAKVQELYRSYQDSGWDGPTITGTERTEIDLDMVIEIMQSRVLTQHDRLLVELVDDRPGLTFEKVAPYKVRDFMGRMAIPYPNSRAIRFRHSDDSKTFLPGSSLGLYHRPDLDLTLAEEVLLVEGETDTWAADDGVRSVVGVPGVGMPPEPHVHVFSGKLVTICFDGDEAGRGGARRWAQALAPTCEVRIVPMPEGKDVASLNAAQFNRLLEATHPVLPNPSTVTTSPTGYMDTKGKEPECLSNFVLVPKAVLHFTNGQDVAYEVDIVAGRTVVATRTVTQDEIDSKTKLNSWLGPHGTWFGSPHAVGGMLADLKSRVAFVPTFIVADRPSLVDGVFTWPSGSIGTTETACYPSVRNPVGAAENFRIEPAEDKDDLALLLQELVDMHDLSITQMLLSWYAMAPLRSLYAQAPSLMVTGRAGSGKTTLVRTMQERFAGVHFSLNLTSTTPYGLTMVMGGSNCFPTWIDEYRPGAKVSTMQMMDQFIRDSYNAATSLRGGMESDKTQVTSITTDSPLVISGEDYADEQSHRDRIIKVFVPRNGKRSLPAGTGTLAYDYLLWLTKGGEYDAPVVEDPPAIDPTAHANVTERQAWNLAWLDAGWDLLSRYAWDRFNLQLPDSDFSVAVEQAEEDAGSDPVAEQILSLRERRGDDVVWEQEGCLYIHPSTVLAELTRTHESLPFRTASALSKYLVDYMDGERIRFRNPVTGTQQRVIMVPLSAFGE